MRSTPAAAAALAAATVAVSFSAIFIRIAGDDATTIVWARMALAVALLAPVALRRGIRTPARRDAVLVLGSGVLLAGHFLLWTASLSLTSVAASVLLVSLHPVVVAPLGQRVLGERPGARVYAGLALALAGTVITCAGDVRIDVRALLGDLMALGGAACLAGYLVIGREVRSTTSTVRYSATVYGACAIVAAAVAGATGHAHMPDARVVLCCLALAAVCTIGGHTVYNWTLRRAGAIVVSVAFLGEAPMAALLAALLLGAVPPLATVVGGAVILAGLALTLAPARPAAPRTAPALDQL